MGQEDQEFLIQEHKKHTTTTSVESLHNVSTQEFRMKAKKAATRLQNKSSKMVNTSTMTTQNKICFVTMKMNGLSNI